MCIIEPNHNKIKIINLPFRIGQSLDIALIGPRLVNCPIANSKYSNGIPQNIITKKYGIKNIPRSNRWYIIIIIILQMYTFLTKIYIYDMCDVSIRVTIKMYAMG